MNKSELVAKIADKSDISKAAAERALQATVDAVTAALKKGDSVTLVGFGTFSVSRRGSRKGKNPRTGATITIKARNTPKFKPGKALKDSVN